MLVHQRVHPIWFCPFLSQCFPMVPESRMAAQLLLNQLRDIGILLQRRVRHLCSVSLHGATEAVTVLDGPVIDQVHGQCWRVGELEQGSFFAVNGIIRGLIYMDLLTMHAYDVCSSVTIHGMI